MPGPVSFTNDPYQNPHQANSFGFGSGFGMGGMSSGLGGNLLQSALGGGAYGSSFGLNIIPQQGTGTGFWEGTSQHTGAGTGIFGKAADAVAGGGGLFGSLGKSLFTAAKANPVGAVLGGLQFIGGLGKKTAEAQRKKEMYAGQIDSARDAITEQGEVRDATKEVSEEERDIGFTQAGMKSERSLDALYRKGRTARVAGQGLVSGEVEADILAAEEDILEGGEMTQNMMVRQKDKSDALADAQFDEFEDRAKKQIDILQKATGQLKTKWWQNIGDQVAEMAG
jgi:hypothetical protein